MRRPSEGTIWFLACAGMLFIGLWKNINLINFLACVLLLLWWINRRVAWRQVRGLQGKVAWPDEIFAEAPALATLLVSNPRRNAAQGLTFEMPGVGWPWYLPHLAPHSSQFLHREVRFPRRGRQALPPLQARSGFPFGLSQASVDLTSTGEVIVFPALGTLNIGRLRRMLQQKSLSQGQIRSFPQRHPSAQTDFHGLRAFQPGDSPRWVHWRTTARRGELMVKEFEESPSDHMILLIDVNASAADLEAMLSCAATIVSEWCRERGEFLAIGLGSQFIHGSTNPDLARRMLTALADARPSSEPAGFLELLTESRLPSAPVLVLSTGSNRVSEAAASRFHRPVWAVDLGRGQAEEFFQPPRHNA